MGSGENQGGVDRTRILKELLSWTGFNVKHLCSAEETVALRRLPKTVRGWQSWELKQALKGTAMHDPIYDVQANDVHPQDRPRGAPV